MRASPISFVDGGSLDGTFAHGVEQLRSADDGDDDNFDDDATD
jgi:hypothetical protein